ncbi:YeeE/YedE family protein, partial [bacterium]|nr:YeeE/YedE family protein [bacterium]
GASGAVKSVMISVVNIVAPSHVENTPYYSTYMAGHNNSPMKSWLVFEVLGVLIGGFISGLISNRLGFKIERGLHISSRTRLIAAVIGGALFGIGSQLGRGCTSGAALSGMAVLSTAGFVTMLAIFGSGYILAYFFRKLWL